MRVKLFSSPLYRFLNRVADLICISLLTLIFSIPLITSFSAITAAHNLVQDIVFDTETTIFKKFFQAFCKNFKQATATGMIATVIVTMAFANFYLMPMQFEGINASVLSFILGIVLFLVLSITFSVFPLVARYRNSFLQHWKNTIILCISAFPRIFIITVIHLAPFVIAVSNPNFLIYTLAFWIFLWPGVILYLTNRLLKQAFLKIEQRICLSE